METKFWVGVGFGAVSLLFFMVAYFKPPRVPGQFVILKVIASILAGAAGLFLSGEVFTQLTSNPSPGAQFTVSATGAIALFVLVWLTFPRPPKEVPPPAQAWVFSFPRPTTFRQAAEVIRDVNGATMDFHGFKPQEENVALSTLNINEATQLNAFKRLASLAPPKALPPYEVRQTRLHFDLIAKRG